MSYSDDEVAAKIARLCKRTHSLLSVLRLCPRAFAQQVALVTGGVKRASLNAKTLEDATGGLGLFSRESWFLFIGTLPLKCALCRGIGSSPVYRWGRGGDSTYVCCLCLFRRALVKPVCCQRAASPGAWPFVHDELVVSKTSGQRGRLP